eukprot:scaffold168058_cov55-Attheya_sp.AAC.1
MRQPYILVWWWTNPLLLAECWCAPHALTHHQMRRIWFHDLVGAGGRRGVRLGDRGRPMISLVARRRSYSLLFQRLDSVALLLMKQTDIGRNTQRSPTVMYGTERALSINTRIPIVDVVSSSAVPKREEAERPSYVYRCS